MSIDITLAILIGTLSIAMAVLGGVIATEKRSIRYSFFLMGLISVAVIIFQAVRAAHSQDQLASAVTQVQQQQVALSQSQADLEQAQQKLSEAQSSLASSQDQLIDLTTGGDAYPGMRMSKNSTADPKADELSFYIVNQNETRSLYAVSVSMWRDIVLPPDTRHWTEPLQCGLGSKYSEIAPRDSVEICTIPFEKYSDVFRARINAGNGVFEAEFSWNAKN